jgi:hypothetical protein
MPMRVVKVAPAVALIVVTGCARNSTPPPAPAPSASATVTVDRLLPGELGESTTRALGLPVPREMRVERIFSDSFVARGHVDVEPLANYVRRRVDASSVEIGAARTLFPKAHVKGEPDAKMVRIEVVRDNDSSLLIVRDITPPPVAPGLSDDERWRKAGVVPGKPFDPKAL